MTQLGAQAMIDGRGEDAHSPLLPIRRPAARRATDAAPGDGEENATRVRISEVKSAANRRRSTRAVLLGTGHNAQAVVWIHFEPARGALQHWARLAARSALAFMAAEAFGYLRGTSLKVAQACSLAPTHMQRLAEPQHRFRRPRRVG